MNGDSYNELQDIREREYRSAYQEWVNGLTPKQRKELDDQSLGEALIEARGVGAPELDEARLVSESSDPSEVAILREGFENTPGEGADRLGGHATAGEDGGADFPPERRSLQDKLRTVVEIVFDSPGSPNLTAGIIGCALRSPRCSVKRIAKRHRLSHAAVLERVEVIRGELGEIDDWEDRRALRAVIGEVAGQDRTLMSLEVLSLVSGICYKGHSETEIANRHKKSRAAVSKRCVELCERLGVPPSRSMKSESARTVYAEAQNDHYRRETEKEFGYRKKLKRNKTSSI